jgi:hypothetical protein
MNEKRRAVEPGRSGAAGNRLCGSAEYIMISRDGVLGLLGRNERSRRLRHGGGTRTGFPTQARLAVQRRVSGDPLALVQITAPVVLSE